MVMVHWYFDEKIAVQRMQEMQQAVDRAQALGLNHAARPAGQSRLRMRLGRALEAMGRRLQGVEPARQVNLASSSQCGLR
jgi:hypothetical protein